MSKHDEGVQDILRAQRESEARAEAERVRLRSAMGGDPAALESRIAALREEMAPIYARMAADQEALRRLIEKRSAATDVLAEARIAEAGERPDWAWLLDASNDGMVAHRAWTKAVEELGLFPSGYNPETNQRCAKPMLTRDDPDSLATTLAALRTLLPHMRPMEDGMVHFGVFEHTLGESGSVDLLVAPDGSRAVVTKGRWSQPAEFGSLEEAVEHVQREHWYQEAPAAAPGRR